MKFFREKKGIFFTFAAIALSLVIILSFNVYKTYEMREDIEVIGVRINTMNSFIKDIEQDLEKGLYISSFRAFASMNQYISSNGTFITNIEDSFNELILEGTLNNQELSLMEDSTFTDWVNKIKIQADKIDILVNFTILDVYINQSDPWAVFVQADINITVEDRKGTSSWERNTSVAAKTSIENLEDPLYIINSNGRVTNAIVRTPITEFIVGGDVTNLQIHLNNSYYIESDTAPNYLMRLQGILSASPNGIESLVNLEKFDEQGLSIKSRSAVDYIYFGTQVTTNSKVDGMPDWFRIDSDHLVVYEIDELP